MPQCLGEALKPPGHCEALLGLLLRSEDWQRRQARAARARGGVSDLGSVQGFGLRGAMFRVKCLDNPRKP